MSDDSPIHSRIAGLENSFYRVRDRVVEIDKEVTVHRSLHDRHSQDIQQLNSTISAQFGKVEAALETIQNNQEAIKGEQSYRRGAFNALSWGIGIFCSVAGVIFAFQKLGIG